METWEQSLLELIRGYYPWLELIGLMDFVVAEVRAGSTVDEILAKARQTPQYRARFPGMVRGDGVRRFPTEADYLREEEAYRSVLREFGAWDPDQDSPLGYLAFMDRGIAPEELRRRLAYYRALERSARDIQDAFYVYAGLQVTVDDLYQAVVSPEFRQQMINRYDEAVAKTPLDYELWITRATDRGLVRAVESLRAMQTLGLATGEAVSRLLAVDPGFAREMMGALFTASVSGTRTLTLDELLSAFDYAMVGSAASEAGFELPSRERVNQFIQAGVDRARAVRGYSEAALRKAGLASMTERHRGPELSQSFLEDAFVSGLPSAQSLVSGLFAQERALGQTGIGFSRGLEGERVVQQGRRLRG